MIFNGNKIAIKFQTDHNSVMGVGLNGIEIIRPPVWINNDAEVEDVASRFSENENYLETNPQICTVVHSNANMRYNPGDKLFVHYMAWEWAEKTEYGSIIDTSYIFFQIMDDGKFETVEHCYLGEAVYEEEEKTNSGIIVHTGKKDNLKVVITHVPIGYKHRPICDIGDTAIAIDKNNYEFNYWGKKYIKIMRDEIAGIYVKEDEQCLGENQTKH